MKAFIINYNRLTLPAKMAYWCADHGLEPIFVDNHSDYPPLLAFYYDCPYTVLRMNHNWGHTIMWNEGINLLRIVGKKERYIVTDSDLCLEGIPSDFLDVLNRGLDRFQLIDKCGFSLEIEDLPDSPEGNYIRYRCETKYWRPSADKAYYNAPIDTTFALYREGVTRYSHKAVRSARPYTARHVPWYYTDLSKLPEDEQYYYKTASTEFSTGIKRGFVK